MSIFILNVYILKNSDSETYNCEYEWMSVAI